MRTLLILWGAAFAALCVACGGHGGGGSGPAPRATAPAAVPDAKPVDVADVPIQAEPPPPLTPKERMAAAVQTVKELQPRINELRAKRANGILSPATMNVGDRGHFSVALTVFTVLDGTNMLVYPHGRINEVFVVSGVSTFGLVSDRAVSLRGPFEVKKTVTSAAQTMFVVEPITDTASEQLVELERKQKAAYDEAMALKADENAQIAAAKERLAEEKRQAEIAFRASPEGKAQEAARLAKIQQDAEAAKAKAAEAKRLAREAEAEKKFQLAMQVADNAKGAYDSESGQRFQRFAATRLEELVAQYPGTDAAKRGRELLADYRSGKPIRRK